MEETPAPPTTQPPLSSPSPPGTILAAGGLIGTGLATLALVAPTIPARVLESPLADRLASFDLALDALGVLFALAMLACAVGLVARGASFVTWSLALVVVHGIFQLGGAAVEKVVFGGTSTLLTLRLVFAVATSLLCFAPLLAAYVILERRRGAPAAPARRSTAFAIVEGCVACLFLGASVLAMAAYSRSLAAFHEAQSPPAAAAAADAADPGSMSAAPSPAPGYGGPDSEDEGVPYPGAEPPPGDDPAARGGADGAAIFRTRLASLDGKTRPLWEKGPAVTLVDFWASWCGPCLYELPNLQVLHDRLSDRGVKIVLVNVDLGGPQEVGRFLKGRRIGLDSL